ncbi:Bacterial regulatory protein, DeoR domain protein [Candidatus Magnetomorum sp. HK-1]|nr:Bacterial regulatory protein, DeoR domain protein [Candidatus Magnetomorum sp. HK-1]
MSEKKIKQKSEQNSCKENVTEDKIHTETYEKLRSSPESKENLKRGDYILEKYRQQPSEKYEIAKHIASEIVNDFDAVLLDAGSTAEVIAEELFIQRKYLTVMTNNMGAYAAYTRAIAPQKGDSPRLLNELLVTGGRYDSTYEALFGDATIEAIKTFSPNITILGVSGFIFNEGIFCHGSEEVRVKKLIWSIPTDKRVIAADWTKIGKRDAFAFGPSIEQLLINAREAVVVTSKPPAETDNKLRQLFDEQISQIRDAGIDVKEIQIPKSENQM